MKRRPYLVLILLAAAAGCGESPTSPSKANSAASLATESAVLGTVSQAMGQMALAGRTTGITGNMLTLPCSGSGSTVITINPAPQQQGNGFSTTSRIEFRDCRNGSVTINGDPYLDSSIDLSFSGGDPTSGTTTSTVRTTGGVRMTANGVQGRVQFNCTTTFSITLVNGASPQVSFSSSGTTTIEQPLGSTPVTRPCGQS